MRRFLRDKTKDGEILVNTGRLPACFDTVHASKLSASATSYYILNYLTRV